MGTARIMPIRPQMTPITNWLIMVIAGGILIIFFWMSGIKILPTIVSDTTYISAAIIAICGLITRPSNTPGTMAITGPKFGIMSSSPAIKPSTNVPGKPMKVKPIAMVTVTNYHRHQPGFYPAFKRGADPVPDNVTIGFPLRRKNG